MVSVRAGYFDKATSDYQMTLGNWLSGTLVVTVKHGDSTGLVLNASQMGAEIHVFVVSGTVLSRRRFEKI